MTKTVLDKITNIVLTLYIFSLYLFTYRESLYIISNGLALLFVLLVIVRAVAENKVVFNRFLLYHMLFIGMCAASIFYAVNQERAADEVRTLVLIYVVMIAAVNFVDSREKIIWAVNAFIFAGLASSVYILLVSDFSNIKRFGDELGNVNDIGMIIGISLTFSFGEFFRKKKIWYLLICALMAVVILLTGSRKGLFFLLFSIVFLLYVNNKGSLKQQAVFFAVASAAMIALFFIVLKVPFFYEVIGKRVEAVIALVTGTGETDTSVQIRKHMIEFGWELFKEKPVFGHGARSYRVIYGMWLGMERYSHNNFIELLVNTGLVGMVLYYITNFVVAKDLYKHAKRAGRDGFGYPLITVIIAYFILGISMVYYYNKHFSLLLALASAVPQVYSFPAGLGGRELQDNAQGP